jgi:hypothetical protein
MGFAVLLVGGLVSYCMRTLKGLIVGAWLGATILLWTFFFFWYRATTKTTPPTDTVTAPAAAPPSTEDRLPSSPSPLSMPPAADKPTEQITHGDSSPIITGSGNTITIESKPAARGQKRRRP